MSHKGLRRINQPSHDSIFLQLHLNLTNQIEYKNDKGTLMSNSNKYHVGLLGALFNQLTRYITSWRRNYLHKKGIRVKVSPNAWELGLIWW
ncbi:hypothetical protein K1719_012233 [Acacia pycnantha]|nr:hypothetical protein K1719_012233 [Acacia pycnantha]